MPLTQVKFNLGSSRDGFCHCGLVLWRPKDVKPPEIAIEGRPPETPAMVGRPGMCLLETQYCRSRMSTCRPCAGDGQAGIDELVGAECVVVAQRNLPIENVDVAVGLHVDGLRQEVVVLADFLAIADLRNQELFAFCWKSRRRSPLSA